MNQKRVVSIQDISCLGKCSLTVALPIISAMGVETCVVPTAVLSTHTGGFQNFTFHDLTGEIAPIAAHWKKEGIAFDAVYTGYLGSTRQIAYVRDILRVKCEMGFAADVKQMILDLGAKTLKDVNPSDYEPLVKAVQALGTGGDDDA